jgi:hypothetical protein
MLMNRYYRTKIAHSAPGEEDRKETDFFSIYRIFARVNRPNLKSSRVATIWTHTQFSFPLTTTGSNQINSDVTELCPKVGDGLFLV